MSLMFLLSPLLLEPNTHSLTRTQTQNAVHYQCLLLFKRKNSTCLWCVDWQICCMTIEYKMDKLISMRRMHVR